MNLRLILALFLILPPAALGHALDPGYLELRPVSGDSWQVFWRKPDVQGVPMQIDAELPENCAPRTGPEPRSDGVAWISTWVATCPGGLTGGRIAIPGLEVQRTDVLLRVQTEKTGTITHRLTPTAPGFVVPDRPTAWGIVRSYFALGFEHILEGWDHLLFVFALLVLIRDWKRLVGAITAFTVAHSITLGLAALGHVSVPGPPVEAVIALSIVFLAVEVLKTRDGEMRLSARLPWLVAFGFGLLHGLGFAGALREIGLPQSDVAAALLAFNLGVEAGQLVFVGVVLGIAGAVRAMAPAAIAALRRPGDAGMVVAGYAIGGVATFWLVERVMGF